MMPSEAIAMLDAQITAHGQSVTLKTGRDGNAQTLSLQAFVRGLKPDELVGGLKQGDRSVIISPTDLAAAAIKAGDALLIAGKRCNIETVDLIHMRDVIVRLNLVVRG